MTTAPSPVGNMMMQQLVQKLAALRQGGSPEAGPGPSPVGGQSPDAAGSALSTQLSGVAGADPEMMVKTLTNIKGMLVSMFNRSAFQLPPVARQLAQAMKYIDNAIKDAQQAAQTVQTVRSQITNNAALSQPDQGMGDGGGL
jgi:hypothetical protein